VTSGCNIEVDGKRGEFPVVCSSGFCLYSKGRGPVGGMLIFISHAVEPAGRYRLPQSLRRMASSTPPGPAVTFLRLRSIAALLLALNRSILVGDYLRGCQRGISGAECPRICCIQSNNINRCAAKQVRWLVSGHCVWRNTWDVYNSALKQSVSRPLARRADGKLVYVAHLEMS